MRSRKICVSAIGGTLKAITGNFAPSLIDARRRTISPAPQA
ncbi:MAG: hypothetical protein ABJH20_18235 [Rhizobiaceae bacterium]